LLEIHNYFHILKIPQFDGHFVIRNLGLSEEVPMTTPAKPYDTYAKEFKLEALRMIAESDRLASEIAMKRDIT